jgi:hypothetical protein
MKSGKGKHASAHSPCSSHKKIYHTRELAEDALLDSHQRFHYRGNNGPVGVYQCSDCGYFHFTSKGETNPKLSSIIEGW